MYQQISGFIFTGSLITQYMILLLQYIHSNMS